MSVRLSSVRFNYPDAPFRLQVPELRIEPGERVALVGPSGAGKSTLLALLAGILVPDAGEIETLGVHLPRESDAARRRARLRMGLVFQEQELVGHLDLIDNVLLPLYLSRRGALTAERARAEQLLRRLGLEPAAHRPSAHLSRGERQRVAVARALVHRPSLVLADEPAASLDEPNAERVWSLLFETVDEDGSTLIASTHEPRLLSRFGRVVEVEQFRGSAAS